MLASQNGWPVIESSTDARLHLWRIPARTGVFQLRLHRGAAGFLLALFALWYAEVIEAVAKTKDDWGWAAFRYVRGSLTFVSNHCSGTAIDLNATIHPLGRRGTFKPWQYVKIRARLALFAGCLRGGLDYVNRPDEMHTEINRGRFLVRHTARVLSTTPRGKRLLAANPGQRALFAHAA
jgi:hypothetical protein